VGEVSYKGHRYPAEIIAHCVWLYHRFPLSFREVEELMLVRGVIVTCETIRQWCAKFGPVYAAAAPPPTPTRRQVAPRRSVLDDQTAVVSICGGSTRTAHVLDILVQRRRDAKAAKRFFRKLLKRQCTPPRVLVTDKLRSLSGGASGR
jgi:putative transposase